MSEYIVEVPDEEAELFIARFGINGTTMFGYQLVDEIVRCRDCKHYENHGSFAMCMRPDGDDDYVCWIVKSDDFCSRGERRTDDN